MAELFDDAEIQRDLLAMTIWDRQFLRSVGDVISQKDFEPVNKGKTSMAWIISGLSLEFYRVNRIPIESLISNEVQKWFKDSGASADRKAEIIKYLKQLKKSYDPTRSEILQKKVKEFKHTKQRQKALRELADLEALGELTTEKWIEVSRQVLEEVGYEQVKDWTAGLPIRDKRRLAKSYKRVPVLMIDPLDILVQSIGRGHLGLWLAPYKAGKSLALIHTAVALLFQSYNVLFVTLEDPIDDVEDRFDACVTEMLISDLGIEGKLIKSRFGRFKEKLTTGLRIIDGTEEGMTVSKIESVWEKQKAYGFDSDVVIIDYDDEIKATVKRQDRRFEFSDIYRDLRKFAARKQIFLWTAAQATRDSEGKEFITAKYTAEDISKIRKCTVVIGIGTGSEGPDSKCLYVAAHKFDRQNVYCTIFGSPERGMFYDREKTFAFLAKQQKVGYKQQ